MSSYAPQNQQRPSALRLALRHYVGQLRRDRARALPGLLLPGLGTILVHYVPAFIIAKVIGVFDREDRVTLGMLVPYIVVFGVLWFAGEMIWRLALWFLNRVEIDGMSRLYVEGMDYLFAKDLGFFHDNYAGSLTKRVIAYARRFEEFVDIVTFRVLSELIPLLFVGVVLWWYSPWLLITLVGMMTLTVLAVIPLIRRRKAMVDAREEASNVLAGHVADSISNMDAVRAFAREDYEAEVHERNVKTFARMMLRSWDYQNNRVYMLTSPLYVLTNVLGLVVAVGIGRGGIFTVEAVFLTFSYYASLTRLLWDFNDTYRRFETIMAEAAQFTELLLEEPHVHDPVSPEALAPRDASIEFRDVRFRYRDDTGEHLFVDLNLHIGSGEKVGLVGRSGGGKTTITRLLLRFMDVEHGNVLVGGQDVSSITQADLRSMIAYVPQDPGMFHRSIADNIRFGRLEATDEEVQWAARLAHAADFIETLPKAYDTLVGERGVKLSGGQRQRIAIARAMIKGAPILVLDEATSSLDSESERLIQDALWTLMEGRTAIVIAHRLSTVQRMDRLVVLERGVLIEQGSHRELLALGGTYAELWAHQSGGFLPGADDMAEHATELV